MFVYKKLIIGTSHDRLGWIQHPHKLLGYGSLIHYFFRYVQMFMYDYMFQYRVYEIFFIVVHLTLSLSSFLFPIREKRNYKNQIIWRELQLHNIVFASRSCAIMLYCILNAYCEFDEYDNCIHKFAIVMIHHGMADIVTYYYKEGTTMRNMCLNEEKTVYKPYLDKFYALAQFGATTYMIFGKTLCMEIAFSTMFAIQISTFLMTLRLKGIINNNMWHMAYSVSLLLTFWVGDRANDHIWHYYLLFYVWRVIFKQHKYLGWYLLFIYHTNNMHSIID